MNNNIVLFFTSGIISFCVYSLLLIALVFTIFKAVPTHYASLRDSMLSLESISIEAIIDENLLESKDKSVGKMSPLAGSGIKNLFDKVDSKKPSKEAPLGDDRALNEQNTKEYKDIQSSAQELKERLKSLSSLTISAKSNDGDGKYDEWYAEIESIIYKKWRQSIYVDEKVTTIAHIRIKSNGVFSYNIVKYSGNSAFDDSLKIMLEECAQMSFPPHPTGSKEIAITFKN